MLGGESYRGDLKFPRVGRPNFALQWAFGATYFFTDTRKPPFLVSDRNFDSSGPPATDTMSKVWEGGLWWGPCREGRIRASGFPGGKCSGIQSPRWRSSQVFPYSVPSPVAAHSLRAGARRCGNSYPPSNQGNAVHWPWVCIRWQLMGRQSNSHPLVVPTTNQGKTPAIKPGRRECTCTYNINGRIIRTLSFW